MSTFAYHQAAVGCEADEGYGCTGHLTGASLIVVERERQIEELGYTTGHDTHHGDHSLLHAARSYADEAIARQGVWANYPHHHDGNPPHEWPWEAKAWKPGDDPVRMLAKAGALIAAEIDRLQRAADPDLTVIGEEP